jgi:hypothetical protein
MGRKLPARDPRPRRRAARTASPPADRRLRELPSRGSHTRFPGKRHAEPTDSGAQGSSEGNRDFNAVPGWSAPSLRVARSGIGALRNQFALGVAPGRNHRRRAPGRRSRRSSHPKTHGRHLSGPRFSESPRKSANASAPTQNPHPQSLSTLRNVAPLAELGWLRTPVRNPWFSGDVSESDDGIIALINTSERAARIWGCYSSGVLYTVPHNDRPAAELTPACSESIQELVPPFGSRQFPVAHGGNSHFSLTTRGDAIVLQMLRPADSNVKVYRVDSTIKFGE